MSIKKTADELLLRLPHQDNFLDQDPWRVFRIMGEFVEGFDKLADLERAITIFGSARTKPDDPMYQKTVEIARNLGTKGFAIITGGGPGIMEAGNKGAHLAGVSSIGLNVQLPFEQHLNPYTSESIEFRYFFARKTMFLKYSCGFVVFPGGFGTMDELFESLCLIQTGKVANFPVVLFGRDYWGGLMNWLEQTMMREGKIARADLDLIFLTDSTDETCEYILRSTGEDTFRAEEEARARETTHKVLSKKSP